MGKLILYHGSDHVIKEPIFGFGEIHNDYGLGFYCTFDKEMAKEWANRYIDSGFINKYQINMGNLKILDLTNEKYSVLNWMAILMHFRDISLANRELYAKRFSFLEKYFYIDVTNYDIVIGYRADDAYFKFPMLFIQNELSIDKLEEIYKLGNLGKQVVLISEKAFSKIKFIDSKPVEKGYYEKYQARKNHADIRFEEIRIEELNQNKDKIEDLMKKYD